MPQKIPPSSRNQVIVVNFAITIEVGVLPRYTRRKRSGEHTTIPHGLYTFFGEVSRAPIKMVVTGCRGIGILGRR